jgi:transcriptional regulator with XRE-family HTH domain
MAKRAANPIDLHVGARIRVQRIVRGMSQTELGNAVGVSFQQLQKYEKGTNRVGASRLHQIASVLKVQPNFFFEGAQAKAGANPGFKKATIIDEFISSRDGIALSHAFNRISDGKMRRSIVSLVERIAQAQPKATRLWRPAMGRFMAMPSTRRCAASFRGPAMSG